MQNLERMRELIQTINEADEAYYKYDAPIMADLEYDRLYAELFTVLVDDTHLAVADFLVHHQISHVVCDTPP